MQIIGTCHHKWGGCLVEGGIVGKVWGRSRGVRGGPVINIGWKGNMPKSRGSKQGSRLRGGKIPVGESLESRGKQMGKVGYQVAPETGAV